MKDLEKETYYSCNNVSVVNYHDVEEWYDAKIKPRIALMDEMAKYLRGIKDDRKTDAVRSHVIGILLTHYEKMKEGKG